MKKVFCFGGLATFLMISASVAQQPAKPEQLKANVIGHKVELSWQNPDLGAVLVTTGFESTDAEPGDRIPLEVDGWTVKTTNSSDFSCTWFNYPTSEFTGADNYDWLIHSGERSAVVYLDIVEDGEHDMHQDEWLISPVLDKAAYLQFSSFIDPRVVINGSDPDYPDHFVVIASTDGGQTWSEPLWDARYDATPEGGWQTVTLALAAAPTETMRVAFRAYGDFIIDEETGDTVNTGLFATWAIDDVTVTAATRPVTATMLVSADFESAESDEDMSLETDGWMVRTTDDYEFTTTWFKNPVLEDDEQFPLMVVNGKRSAMVLPDEAGVYQDEWLVSPELTPETGKSISLSFSYKSSAAYIDEEEGFVFDEAMGHYVVIVSKDGGETWGEPVWSLAADDKGGMTEDEMFYTNTVTVAIEAVPAEKVKIAFRAYGDDMGIDEETGDKMGGLGGIWVLDDIFVMATENDGVENMLISSYKIQLDGKDLATGVQGTDYTDKSEKTSGKHI